MPYGYKAKARIQIHDRITRTPVRASLNPTDVILHRVRDTVSDAWINHHSRRGFLPISRLLELRRVDSPISFFFSNIVFRGYFTYDLSHFYPSCRTLDSQPAWRKYNRKRVRVYACQCQCVCVCMCVLGAKVLEGSNCKVGKSEVCVRLILTPVTQEESTVENSRSAFVSDVSLISTMFQKIWWARYYVRWKYYPWIT